MVDNFSYDTSQVVTCTSSDYVELSITKCVGKLVHHTFILSSLKYVSRSPDME